MKQETKSNKLRFPIHPNQDMETENAQLRILAPPSASSEVQVRLYQILGARRKRLLEDRTLYLHHNLTKWCEFDVTSAVQSWVSGDRNLGLELIWSDTRDFLHPLEAVVSALVYPHRRSRRSVSPYQPLRRTDCNEASRGGKRRCCRHNLTVKFAELRFLEMGSIIQPKSYDLGYCQGQCPPTYNHATNHSRIQSYIHQQDRKNAKRLNRRAVPKACCAPSKLESLDILRVNPQDNTKLIVEKWDNMQVIECACSWIGSCGYAKDIFRQFYGFILINYNSAL